MRWGMLRGAGLGVEPTTEAAAVGSEVIVRLGPVRAPCRVVYVVDEPDRRGFAYGTLPGHPESGEEAFSIHLGTEQDVIATIRAFSRPASVLARVGGPLTHHLQTRATRAYLDALTE